MSIKPLHITTFLLPLVLIMGLFATSALSAELTFRIRSEHPKQVSLEFYSQDRSHVWPGSGEVYILKDWDTHSYSLSCNYGEKICFGAWVRNQSSTYWGVGYNGNQSCTNCCAKCGFGDVETQVLNP